MLSEINNAYCGFSCDTKKEYMAICDTLFTLTSVFECVTF